jgi:hypothetical protein
MTARIIDTAPAFEAFASRAALESPFVRQQLWRDQYEAAHRDVFAAFYAGDASPRHPLAQVRELARVRQQARDGAAALGTVIEEVNEAVGVLLELPPEPAPTHVLLVGGGSVNASVGRLGGAVAVFHCLEWFRSAEDWRVLAAHETAHAWHEIALGVSPPADDLAWITFSEGLAVRASQEAVPGRPTCDYFWYGHPGFDAWLTWCRDHREQLCDHLRDHVDDVSAASALFGSEQYEGHRRTGYFIAGELLTATGRPLRDLVHLSVTEASDLIRSALDS